jgi:hypothetical protein
MIPGKKLYKIMTQAARQVNEELVLTPGGFRPKSLVHLIEPGHTLRIKDSLIQKVHRSGNIVEVYLEIAYRSGKEPLMPGNVNVPVRKLF